MDKTTEVQDYLHQRLLRSADRLRDFLSTTKSRSLIVREISLLTFLALRVYGTRLYLSFLRHHAAYWMGELRGACRALFGRQTVADTNSLRIDQR